MAEYNNRWDWYQTTRNLANNDLTKFDAILGLNLYMVLNDLAYQQETRDIIEYSKQNI